MPICVSYAIYADQELEGEPLSSGDAFTSYDVDWTVKVEATGLKPDTIYYYRFADCTNSETVSDTGRTRTLSSSDSEFLIELLSSIGLLLTLNSLAPADEVNGGKPLTFAVFSCSNYPFGYFNAYAFAAQNTSADVFIHLGDYVSKISQDFLHHDLYISYCRYMNTPTASVSRV